VLKGLQWPLCLPEARYNKGYIHRLANLCNGCVGLSIVISIGREVGDVIACHGRSLISTIALFKVEPWTGFQRLEIIEASLRGWVPLQSSNGQCTEGNFQSRLDA